MNNRSAVTAIAAVGVWAISGSAWAAGFQINEHGAIGTGRAGAVVSTGNDPSMVYHNPALLTRAKGTQFMGGANLFFTGQTYVGRGRPVDALDEPVSQGTNRTPIPAPYAYASHSISKTAAVGIGLFNNYGLTVDWDNPEEFVGRTLIQKLSLRTFFITPVVAMELSERVSVAVGVMMVPSTLLLDRVIGASDNGQVVFPSVNGSPEGTVRLNGTAFGVGATAGLAVSLTDNLRLGLTYRSAVSLNFDGDADFEVPEGTPASVAANFPDQGINGELVLPHVIGGGLGWEASNWSIEVAAQVTFWQSYDELRINFDAGLPVPTTAVPRNWTASPLFRLGGEYRFDSPFAIRAGLAYDVTPIPDNTLDPTLPDNNRVIASLGLGYDFGPVRVDLGYMMLFLSEREVTPEDNNINFPTPSPTESYKYDSAFVQVASLSFGVKL
ncbi:MAG: outer membrane protein transport protein [Myxococcota bacterium]